MKTEQNVVPQGSELAQQFKTRLSSLRIDTLQRLVDTALAMLSAHSVNHRDLAPHMPGKSSLESKQRRAERAIHDPQLTPEVFVLLMLMQLPTGKLLITLDRTNWEHGESSLNLLVIGAVVQGYTVPLMWTALGHSGNSDTLARMWLVGRLLQFLPAHRWKGLIADREFVGRDWFRFLRRHGIHRAVRVRRNTRLDSLRGDAWFEDIEAGQFRCLFEKANVFGEVMQVVATRSPAGDLVLIATDFSIWETWQLYKQRWSIECTFSSLKSRGFDLERTAVTSKAHLERLFGLVVLAWVCCLKVGIWRHNIKPIKVLAHGRRAVSLVRYGSEYLQNALRWKVEEARQLLTVVVEPLCCSGQRKSKVVGY